VALIDVGEVTSWFVTSLTTAEFVMGDGEAPLEGGWSEGQPNAGEFVEYLVIKQQGPVTPALGDTSLCDSTAKFMAIPYQLVAYQTTRVASDVLAAAARATLHAMTGRHVCGDLTVNADQIRMTSVSGATRDDSTYPKFWLSVTNFTVNVARA